MRSLLLQAIEIEGLAGGGIEGGLMQKVMDPQVHGHGAGRRAAQKNQASVTAQASLGFQELVAALSINQCCS